MAEGYFLLIDSAKNTLHIPEDNKHLKEILTSSLLPANIRKHKSRRELNAEITKYLKGGGRTK